MQTAADDVSNWQQIHLIQTHGCKHIMCANIERLFVWKYYQCCQSGASSHWKHIRAEDISQTAAGYEGRAATFLLTNQIKSI